MQLGLREARRIDVDEKKNFDQFIMDLTFWILIVAMIGSRISFSVVLLRVLLAPQAAGLFPRR